MFIIEIGDDIRNQFEYYENDPIFELADAVNEPAAKQNPFCNCCEKSYKSYKETKYW